MTHTSSQATFYCTLRYRGSTSNHFYGLLVPFAQNDGNIYGDISLFLRIQRQYGNLMSALFKLFRCPCGIETKRSQKPGAVTLNVPRHVTLIKETKSMKLNLNVQRKRCFYKIKKSQKPGAVGLNVTNTVTAKHQSEKAQ